MASYKTRAASNEDHASVNHSPQDPKPESDVPKLADVAASTLALEFVNRSTKAVSTVFGRISWPTAPSNLGRTVMTTMLPVTIFLVAQSDQ